MNKSLFNFFTIFFMVGVSSGLSYCQHLQQYYAAAKKAYGDKDYEQFYENITAANQLHPYHQGILYQLGMAAARVNKTQEALSALRKAIHIDAGFDLNTDDFETIRNSSGFQSLYTLKEELQKVQVKSDTAFLLNDNGSHIESIAIDELNNEFYFASIHKKKILKRDKAGNLTDFVRSGAFGLTAVFDLEIDKKNNVLWACASPMPEMEGYDTVQHSALFKFDLKSGALIDKYETKEITSSVFGDLTLNSKGQVFVSDGKTNTIFTIDEKSKTLNPYFTSEEFWNIQGIAFSDDDHILFIADYIKGPYRLNTLSMELTQFQSENELSLKGIDGLLYFNNSLVAIQNGVRPNRVTRYELDQQQMRIISATIIDKAHPSFNEPTMGCIYKNKLYYIANSAWGAYDENHALKPELIKDVVVLTAELK